MAGGASAATHHARMHAAREPARVQRTGPCAARDLGSASCERWQADVREEAERPERHVHAVPQLDVAAPARKAPGKGRGISGVVRGAG